MASEALVEYPGCSPLDHKSFDVLILIPLETLKLEHSSLEVDPVGLASWELLHPGILDSEDVRAPSVHAPLPCLSVCNSQILNAGTQMRCVLHDLSQTQTIQLRTVIVSFYFYTYGRCHILTPPLGQDQPVSANYTTTQLASRTSIPYIPYIQYPHWIQKRPHRPQ